MCDEELQLSLSSWNIGSSGRRAATQPPSTAKPLRASSYRSAADILARTISLVSNVCVCMCVKHYSGVLFSKIAQRSLLMLRYMSAWRMLLLKSH